MFKCYEDKGKKLIIENKGHTLNTEFKKEISEVIEVESVRVSQADKTVIWSIGRRKDLVHFKKVVTRVVHSCKSRDSMSWDCGKVRRTSGRDKGFGFYSKSYGKTPKLWADMRQNLHFNNVMAYCCCIEHGLVRGKYGRGEISWISNNPFNEMTVYDCKVRAEKI